MRYQDPALLGLLAGEYALGTLQGRARLRLEGLMESDPAAAEQVRLWQSRLAPWGHW